jgi:hypothetical protein
MDGYDLALDEPVDMRTTGTMCKTKLGFGSRGRRGRGAVVLASALALIAVGGCSDLLEVELPSALTDDVLDDPTGAAVQVASVIANIECGYSAFGWVRTLGAEDVLESVAGRGGGHAVHNSQPDTGAECDLDGDSSNGNYYDQFQIARSLAWGTYERLENWTDEEVPGSREELLATTALYAGIALEHFGTYYCEMTFDNGPLMTPSAVMDLAEQWINTSLGHIGNAGDFEIDHGASASARTMALALRARIRWHNGDLAGAAADAAQVPEGFTAWIVRDVGPQRRNKIYESGTQTGWGGMLGINDWWHRQPQVNQTNPVTGSPWPDPIPFTGYIFLGIMPDGRAIDDDGYPVTYAEEFRAAGDEPTLLNNGAVPDVRVQHFKKSIQGPEPREVPARYSAEDDDIPLVDWEEIWLILAEIEGGQQAIDRVNVIRRHYNLPEVTYADPGDAEQIRYMIIEERRRSFFAEGGRYWATKILNTDILWFPRTEGVTPAQGYDLNGGVRLTMPGDEYTLNPNISLNDRATGCDPDQAPTQDPDWDF